MVDVVKPIVIPAEIPFNERQRAVVDRLSSGKVITYTELHSMMGNAPDRAVALRNTLHTIRRKLPEGMKIVSHRKTGYSLTGE